MLYYFISLFTAIDKWAKAAYEKYIEEVGVEGGVVSVQNDVMEWNALVRRSEFT